MRNGDNLTAQREVHLLFTLSRYKVFGNRLTKFTLLLAMAKFIASLTNAIQFFRKKHRFGL